ncbi:MAG: hypothetical protein HZA48_10275 [Planctomycetes bacterium]|nr:hypothetical protein [Planctomycetota bacterium]
MNKSIFLTISAVVLLLPGAAFAGDYHRVWATSTLVCSDCHTLHAGSVPYPVLLKYATVNELCASCHDGTDTKAPDVISPVTMYTGDEHSGAGFFANTGGSASDVAHDLGVSAAIPMSTKPAMTLICTTCHDPHGNGYYRNLKPDPDGDTSNITVTIGTNMFQQNSPPIPPNAATVADAYKESNIGYKSNISAWCSQCHDKLASNQAGTLPSHFKRHPADVPLNSAGYHADTANWITNPLGNPTSGGGVATGDAVYGIPRLRYQVSTATDYASAKTVAVSNQVFCGSCHTAHGMKYQKNLVWPYRKQTGIDNTDAFAACQQCHNQSYWSGSPHGNTTTGVARTSSNPTGACNQCHDMHDDVTSYNYALYTTNTNSLCFTTGCHVNASASYPAQEADRNAVGYFTTKRWPGQTSYENATYSQHYLDADCIYPGKSYSAGDCKNCHDPHGSANTYDMTLNTYIDGGVYTNYQLCFDCHNETTGPAGMNIAGKYVKNLYSIADNQSGHQIRNSAKSVSNFAGSKLAIGDKLPCYDCHGPHGSKGNNGTQPNKKILSDQRTGWSNLDTAVAANNRTFCLGCHVASNGVAGSNTVEGIAMNTIPVFPSTGFQPHATTGTDSCSDCHGDNYTNNTARNAHHPDNSDCKFCHNAAQGSHRQVVQNGGTGGDFDDTTHHIGDVVGTENVTNADCVMCHKQSNHPYTTDATTIYLRNVDTGAAITYVRGDTSSANLTNLDNFCLACHDAAGANGDTTPFSDNAVALDVNAQFNTANPSHHAVKGARYTPAGASGILAAAFVNGWADNSTLHCSDCHCTATNAHGDGKAVASRPSLIKGYTSGTVYPGGTAGVDGYICFLCHGYLTYDTPNITTPNNSRFDHNANGGHATKDVYRGIYCLVCHGGYVKGYIHGENDTSDINIMQHFLSGAALRSWQRSGANESCNTTGSISACSQHNGGKTYGYNY